MTTRRQVDDRDRVILDLIAQGSTNRQIADVVGASYETVRRRLATIYSRNGISEGPGGKNRRELARRYRLGLIDQ